MRHKEPKIKTIYLGKKRFNFKLKNIPVDTEPYFAPVSWMSKPKIRIGGKITVEERRTQLDQLVANERNILTVFSLNWNMTQYGWMVKLLKGHTLVCARYEYKKEKLKANTVVSEITFQLDDLHPKEIWEQIKDTIIAFSNLDNCEFDELKLEQRRVGDEKIC